MVVPTVITGRRGREAEVLMSIKRREANSLPYEDLDATSRRRLFDPYRNKTDAVCGRPMVALTKILMLPLHVGEGITLPGKQIQNEEREANSLPYAPPLQVWETARVTSVPTGHFYGNC